MAQIFVYGTLKQGNFNHHLLADAEFVGPACSTEAFPLVVGSRYNIPFLLPLSGVGNRVYGEVYRVNDEQLIHLDELEMHPHVYERQELKVDVKQSDDITTTMCCQAYFLVRALPSMLQLPHLDKFVDNVGDRQYVNPLIRSGEPFRFQVQYPPDGTPEEIEAWRKL